MEVASSSLAVGTMQRSSMEEYPAHNREVGGSKPPVVSRPDNVLKLINTALAQLVERRTFNPVVVGSSPTCGNYLW